MNAIGSADLLKSEAFGIIISRCLEGGIILYTIGLHTMRRICSIDDSRKLDF